MKQLLALWAVFLLLGTVMTVSGGRCLASGEELVLTDAPEAPPPIKRSKAANLVVHLETKELRKRMADGVDYTFWTFGGSVPGSLFGFGREIP